MAKTPPKKVGRKSKADQLRLKAQARLYYLHSDYTQKQIAEMLGVHESTVGDWVEKDQWKQERQIMDNTPSRLRREFYSDIDAIRKKAKDEDRSLDSKETDSIKKLTSSIADLSNNLSPSICMEVLMNFGNHMKSIDLELQKSFLPHMKEFIARMLTR